MLVNLTASDKNRINAISRKATSYADCSLIRLATDKFFDLSPVSTPRGHGYKLYKPRWTNAVRKISSQKEL